MGGMKSAATKPLALPSIPYIVDGDMHIFQSMAVLKYAGRKAGLCAKDEAGKQIEDISQGFLTEDTASWIDFMLWHMFHFYCVYKGETSSLPECLRLEKQLLENDRLAAYVESVKDVPPL